MYDDERLKWLLCARVPGGMTYRQCLKYSDCEYGRLGQMFPQVSSFTFKCCNSDLCNSAHSAAASSLIGALVELIIGWTGVF
uniref:UPAR/Ly6 domain-containing protein n=1 Tax=Hippocampus comes TaxID=109280 RepID=A0A3Q2YWJ0_HIPCM